MAGKLSPGRLLAPLPKKKSTWVRVRVRVGGNLSGASFLVHFID